MMINVTALTLGRNDPSSRFRVRQFIAPLKSFGVDVSESHLHLFPYKTARIAPLGVLARVPGVLKARRRSSDITWLSRELVLRKSTLERFAGTKRLFDVDDAIWLTGKSKFSEKIAADCAGVIAGNRFIAEHYRAHGARRVWVVPTSIDTDIWHPSQRKTRDEWIVGWIGTASNLKYLYAIEDALAEFLTQNAQSGARLLVVSDKRPSFSKIPAHLWRFKRWRMAEEVAQAQEMDVGLMPLDDTEWARGKCAFKMLSYMSVGLPVVVSPVGVNRELLEQSNIGFAASAPHEWHEALQRLYDDTALARRMGANGRRVVVEDFSVTKNAAALAAIFQEVAGE